MQNPQLVRDTHNKVLLANLAEGLREVKIQIVKLTPIR